MSKLCQLHQRPFSFVCKNLDCQQALLCASPDCVKAHHHNSNLTIFSLSKMKEATQVDNSTDLAYVESMKEQLQNFFSLMQNQIMEKIQAMKRQAFMQLQKVLMHLTDIDSNIKKAHEDFIQGNYEAIGKESFIKLAKAMKFKLDDSSRFSLYEQLRSDIHQRISKSEGLIQGLSKSSLFASIFNFKINFKGPVLAKQLKRFSKTGGSLTHSPQKSDAIRLTVKSDIKIKGMTIYQIEDWQSSQIIILSMLFYQNQKTVFTQEIILSKEIHSDRNIQIQFDRPARLKAGEKYDIVITNMGEFYKSKSGSGLVKDDVVTFSKSKYDNNGTDPENGQFFSFNIEMQ